MTTAATTIEPTALASIISNSGLPAQSGDQIVEKFRPFVAEAGILIAEAKKITVTEATQLTEMQEARRIRLKLRDVRVKAEAARKELKADALKYGTTVDASNRWLLNEIEPEEARLQDCEDFAKNAEAVRLHKRWLTRSGKLSSLGVNTGLYNLLDMKDEDFTRLVEDSKLAKQARADAEVRAEQERVAKAKQEAEERDRMKVERDKAEAERQAALVELKKANDKREAEAAKAKKERDAIEAKARKEKEAAAEKVRKVRAEADAKLQAEREARENLENAERERKRLADAAKAKEARDAAKAARAPDKAKIIAFGKAIAEPDEPKLTTADGKTLMVQIMDRLSDLCNFIETEAARL